ncbi:MAG TPA: TlpA family protein disulfide reductase [Flavobacterium sp.]|nr:TlpA family protein disulfide reductase [Flavobacterium sp.]HPJ11317.1 TlpA family protein disulfide reductase [Flavobacterium sp.]
MVRVIVWLFSLSVAVSANAQQPLKVYVKNGVTVKSYDFNELAPLLNKQNDTTYVVNFWATWCKPCVEELPHFEKLHANFKDQKVKVLLVSLDLPKQVESNLIPYIRKKQLQSYVVHLGDPDMNSWINKVDPQWSGAIPATIIYNGRKRKFYEQSFSYEQLQTELEKIKN